MTVEATTVSDLRSHQRAFLETALNPATGTTLLLKAPPGFGKTTALMALSHLKIREQPTARVLVLCAAPLQRQWAERLRHASERVLLVDRYKFRELQDLSPEDEFWPKGIIAILSDDFAKQPDISDCLSSIDWDLVIVEEAHRLMTGRRAELLVRIRNRSKRIVLATATDVGFAGVLPTEDTTVVDWHRDQFTGPGGKTGLVAPPDFREVSFVLTPAEKHVADVVRELCERLDANDLRHTTLAQFLHRAWRSSPASLEHVLRGLAAGVSAPIEDEELSGSDDQPEVEGDLVPFPEETRLMARNALQVLEASQVDSKLAACVLLLRQLTETGAEGPWVCVIADYNSTVHYLAAELDSRGLAYRLIRGGMRHQERRDCLSEFADAGGILLSTKAAMAEGVDLAEVTDAVLYDVPRDVFATLQLLGRFDRLGRESRLSAHVLVELGSTDQAFLQSLRAARI